MRWVVFKAAHLAWGIKGFVSSVYQQAARRLGTLEKEEVQNEKSAYAEQYRSLAFYGTGRITHNGARLRVLHRYSCA